MAGRYSEMVAGTVQQVIRAYLNAAEEAGIPVRKAILFEGVVVPLS